MASLPLKAGDMLIAALAANGYDFGEYFIAICCDRERVGRNTLIAAHQTPTHLFTTINATSLLLTNANRHVNRKSNHSNYRVLLLGLSQSQQLQGSTHRHFHNHGNYRILLLGTLTMW